MRDKFAFSEGQALSTLNSTGVISTNIWDLEQDDGGNVMETDSQVFGWFNFNIRSSTNTSGGAGMWVEIRTEDETNLDWDSASAGEIGDDADMHCLGAILLKKSEIVAGFSFAIAVSKFSLGRYLGIWYRAANASLDGATAIDASFNINPEVLGITQKKP